MSIYTPLSDADMARLLLDWGRSFVVTSTKRLAQLEARRSEVYNVMSRAESIEQHDRSMGRDEVAGWSLTARQVYDNDVAKLDAEKQGLITADLNNKAMVAFIERLLEDMPKKVALSVDENELLQFKAHKAADSYERTLIGPSADTWSMEKWAWMGGWTSGYLARKTENQPSS